VTHRDFNTAFTVMTGHEDPTKPESTIDWSKLADPHRTLVLLMAMGNLASITERLVTAGLSAQTSCAVIANGTRPSQRTVTGTLADIASICTREKMKAPAIVIVGDVVRVREELRWFDRDPLFGKRMLVTRPATGAQEFARALYRRGIEPILGSTIHIGPPDDSRASEAAVAALAPYTWIVFTSRNGVERFFALLHASHRDVRALGGHKIAAIGAKTAAALRTYGIDADLVPKVAVGEELAATLLAATTSGDHLLLFRAQDGRDVLPEHLRAAKRTVSDVAAYATRFVDDAAYAEKVADADIVTFTSASTVEGFVHLLGGREAAQRAASGKCVACIGPITAAAARENGLHVDVVSNTADTDALLDAVAATYSAIT
ncbi:MAG: uroporphyrinogen-III synthase, partial [Vulcanimicrobiaceae bacterium]